MTFEKSLERYNSYIVLRNKGKTYREIAAIYKVSKQAVFDRIKKGMPIKSNYLNPFWENKPSWLREGREATRERVRARDNYTCQDCGKKWTNKQRRFDVHHLNGQCGKKSRGYDKISDIDKMITLCHKCHFRRTDHSNFKKWRNQFSPQ